MSTPGAAAKPLLLDFSPSDPTLTGLIPGPDFRRRQVFEWVYQKRVQSFEAMTNLPAALRKDLEEAYELHPLQCVQVQGAKDTTRKFLWRLRGGDFIESVLIPANPALYGERSDRLTLCVSTQVGCAYGCKFCASGLDGWKRHLTPGEIVAQVMEAERQSGQRISNLVFMGMGEPLANYNNLMAALDALNEPWGMKIGARHITLSTSGLAPRIRDLADQPRQVRLAISLHGASNEVREQIMPVNRKYPIEDLLDACAYFITKKKQMITFEYILINGINDSPEQAKKLATHGRRLKAKINLIPYNKVEGLPWERPDDDTIRQFHGIVTGGGVTATVRLEKGHDIDAACGQLRLQKKREEEQTSG
jgi:23S rRNA (adenine2503-C2)-methyltransferase